MNTYYTAFLVKPIGFEGVDLHVTHKYLGEQPDFNVDDFLTILNNYFSVPRVVKNIEFANIDYLGPHYQRAYIMSDFANKAHLFLDLRFLFDDYRKDDFSPWLPHVTTIYEYPRIFEFTKFVLYKDDEIIFEAEI